MLLFVAVLILLSADISNSARKVLNVSLSESDPCWTHCHKQGFRFCDATQNRKMKIWTLNCSSDVPQ
uniref:Uncharacterized protein n=1 Tax=Parascaris univalens TaxID=6257 RepID=A0A915C5U5_PARUN